MVVLFSLSKMLCSLSSLDSICDVEMDVLVESDTGTGVMLDTNCPDAVGVVVFFSLILVICAKDNASAAACDTLLASCILLLSSHFHATICFCIVDTFWCIS